MPINFLKSLDADDIFISYSRADGSAYLKGLDAALSARGFSCFTDERGTDADPLPPKTLFAKIRACKTLVLLGTPAALGHPENITPELTEFAASNGTARIVCVGFDRGAQFDAWPDVWHRYVVGKAREREDPDAIRTGKPSDSVVETVARASDYMKSKDRLRKYRNRTAVFVLLLLALGLAAGAFALYEFREAGRAMTRASSVQKQADATIAKANDDARRAVRQAQADIEKAREDAQTKISEAEAQTKAADDKRAAADAARVAAQSQADREQAIAESRSLANRSQTLLRSRPEELREGVSLAVGSVKKAVAVGGGIIEADTALRESLALLPYFRPARDFDADSFTTALSPDGQHFASLPFLSNTLRVYEVRSRSQPVDIPASGHTVALSNGGLYVAFASNQGVTIFDVKSKHGEPLKTEARTDNVGDIALSPGGKYIAIVPRGNILYTGDLRNCGAERAQVLDVKSGKVVKTIVAADLGMEICDIAFGPSGNLAIGGRDLRRHGDFNGQVVIWPLSAKLRDGESGGGLTEADFSNPITEYQDEVVTLVAPGEDETSFATDKAVWKSTRRFKYEAVTTIPASKEESKCRSIDILGNASVGSILNVAFNPGGRQLTVARCLPKPPDPKLEGSAPHALSLETWDATGHRELARAFSPKGVSNLGFAPGGRFVAVSESEFSQEMTVRVFGAGDGAEVKSFAVKQETESGKRVFVTPDARYVLSAEDDTAQVRDVWGKSPAASATLERDFGYLNEMVLSSDGKTFALLGQVGENGGYAAAVYRADGNVFKKEALKLDNKMLISRYKSQRTFDLSPDGRLLATATGQPDAWGVRLWDLGNEGKAGDVSRGRLLKCDGLPRSVQFSPEGSYVAAICAPKYVRVWRVADGEEVGSLEYEVGPLEYTTGISFYLFGPADQYLFAAGGSGHSQLLHLPTKRARTLLRDTHVGAAAFSRDGRHLAVGTGEGLVRVYRTSDFDSEVARLPHEGSVTAIAFSDDARYVVTTGARRGPYGTGKEDFPLRVWLLRHEDLLTEAAHRLERLPKFAR